VKADHIIKAALSGRAEEGFAHFWCFENTFAGIQFESGEGVRRQCLIFMSACGVYMGKICRGCLTDRSRNVQPLNMPYPALPEAIRGALGLTKDWLE